MKRFHLLLICVVVLPFTACQQHSLTELAIIEGTPEQGANHAEAKQSTAPAKTKDSGPAPQFFPESK